MQHHGLPCAAIVAIACAFVPGATAQRPLTVTGLPEDAPVTITADATPARLTVHAVIAKGWHLYGRDVGGGQPAEAEVVAGSSFAADGALRTPMDAAGLITGTAELTLPLRRVADGERLSAKLRFMICDALQCLPPIEVALDLPAANAAGAPVRVLLVAVDEGERTARIAAFLEERGFVTAVTTYAKVTKEACDAQDVVVADSPYFGQTKGARVAGFPETTAPIVAVGFLGTELLKAQRVSMACGYI